MALVGVVSRTHRGETRSEEPVRDCGDLHWRWHQFAVSTISPRDAMADSGRGRLGTWPIRVFQSFVKPCPRIAGRFRISRPHESNELTLPQNCSCTSPLNAGRRAGLVPDKLSMCNIPESDTSSRRRARVRTPSGTSTSCHGGLTRYRVATTRITP
jgi:hypothetical protein